MSTLYVEYVKCTENATKRNKCMINVFIES